MQAPVFLTNWNSLGFTDLLAFELIVLIVEIVESVKLLLRDLDLLELKSETGTDKWVRLGVLVRGWLFV